MSKLSLFNNIKHGNVFEPYITLIDSYKLRTLFTKLRCGSLNIEVNAGRYQGIPRDRRYCTFCNTADVGDEFHFLLICPFFREIRSLFIPSYYYEFPCTDKFYEMLRSNNKKLLLDICHFLCHSMKLRREIDMLS